MGTKLSSKELFKWASYLGTQVAERVKIGKHDIQILKETSCMSRDFRKFYSYIELLKLTLEKDDPLLKEINEFILPAIQILGMSEWERDTLTDMAMRVGSIEKFYSLKEEKDAKDVEVLIEEEE